MSLSNDNGIALIGSGALALEIIELVGSSTFSACYTDPEFISLARVDLPLFSDLQALRKKTRYFILGLAVPADRVRLTSLLIGAGFEPASPLIMPSAVISPSSSIGLGTIIGNGTQLGSQCKIGAHNVIMHHVVLGHDTTTGEHVIFNSGVCVAGYVNIADNVVVNANATLATEIDVGDNAFIAPGAVCFRSVPAGFRAVGNPARLFSPDVKCR